MVAQGGLPHTYRPIHRALRPALAGPEILGILPFQRVAGRTEEHRPVVGRNLYIQFNCALTGRIDPVVQLHAMAIVAEHYAQPGVDTVQQFSNPGLYLSRSVEVPVSE